MKQTYLTQAFFNETRGSRFERYEEGVELVPSKLEPFYTYGTTPEQAAQEAWHSLNIDERANGSFERSLSVGDLIRLHLHDVGEVGIVIWLAVEGRGFRQVDGPVLEVA